MGQVEASSLTLCKAIRILWFCVCVCVCVCVCYLFIYLFFAFDFLQDVCKEIGSRILLLVVGFLFFGWLVGFFMSLV